MSGSFKVSDNGRVLGEVAFVRWLVCRVAFAKPVLYEVPTYLR